MSLQITVKQEVQVITGSSDQVLISTECKIQHAGQSGLVAILSTSWSSEDVQIGQGFQLQRNVQEIPSEDILNHLFSQLSLNGS